MKTWRDVQVVNRGTQPRPQELPAASCRDVGGRLSPDVVASPQWTWQRRPALLIASSPIAKLKNRDRWFLVDVNEQLFRILEKEHNKNTYLWTSWSILKSAFTPVYADVCFCQRIHFNISSPSTAVVPNLFWCIPPFAHFGAFHSSPVQVRWQLLTTIGTMVFIDDNNLINKSGTKTLCCQIMALKFVNKNVW